MRSKSLFLVTALVLALPACADISSPPADDAAAAAGGAAAAPLHLARSAGWGPAVPVNGTALVNTSASEGCPHESPDGQSLFFASNRSGNNDIYVSRRQPDGTWGDPERLPNTVNSTANDFCPTPLPGGGLLFVSERTDGLNCGTGTADIYESRLHPSQGWLPAEHLGCVLNSAGNEFSPSFSPAAGGMLFFSSDQDAPHGIYVSHRGADGSWQTPVRVDELNLGSTAFRPNVSADGRVIVFDSNRTGSTGLDIWYSHRATPHSTWAEPVRLFDASINSPANEARASMSRDGRRLYFGSNRGTSLDLYVAERR